MRSVVGISVNIFVNSFGSKAFLFPFFSQYKAKRPDK